MIIKSNSTFSLVQTMTDQLLLVVNGTVSQPVLRSWHISKKMMLLMNLTGLQNDYQPPRRES